MDCDSFAVEDHSGKYEVITLNCRTSISISLGIYSTEEKALLVLDMIEKVSMYSGNTLFQMPADEEVEV